MSERLQDALDACAGLTARVVVTTGPHVDPASLRVPAGVEVHRFVPHDELMPRASVVVGHGGHGTTMRALAHDAPVVVLPMDPRSDHLMVGRSLERAGAGRVVPPRGGPRAASPRPSAPCSPTALTALPPRGSGLWCARRRALLARRTPSRPRSSTGCTPERGKEIASFRVPDLHVKRFRTYVLG